MNSSGSQHQGDERHSHWYTPHAHRNPESEGAEYSQNQHGNMHGHHSSHTGEGGGSSQYPPHSGAYHSSASSQGRSSHGPPVHSPSETGSVGNYRGSPFQSQHASQAYGGGYSRHSSQSRGPSVDPRYAYDYPTGGRESLGPEDMRHSGMEKGGHGYYQQPPPQAPHPHYYAPPPHHGSGSGGYPGGPPPYSQPMPYGYPPGRYYPYGPPPTHHHAAYPPRGGYPGYEYPPESRMEYDPNLMPPGQYAGRPDSRAYEQRRFTFPALSSNKSGVHHQGPSRSPSPVIPPPPSGNVDTPVSVKLEDDVDKDMRNEDEKAMSVEMGGPLRESKRQNRNEEGQQSPSQNNRKTGGKKKQAVDAASILLEFQKTSKSTSPATTIESLDEQQQDSLKPKVSTDGDDIEAPPPTVVVEKERPYPVPKNYPTRLALPSDKLKLNKLHCFLRSELLEVFVIDSTTHEGAQSSVGRVGLRCVHCALNRKAVGDVPKEEAAMAVFYPKTVAEIYRLVTSWQRCHLRKCRTLPPSVRAEWQDLRDKDKSRGKTSYWISSAHEIGLIDIPSKAGGIRFAVEEGDEKESAEPEADNNDV